MLVTVSNTLQLEGIIVSYTEYLKSHTRLNPLEPERKKVNPSCLWKMTVAKSTHLDYRSRSTLQSSSWNQAWNKARHDTGWGTWQPAKWQLGQQKKAKGKHRSELSITAAHSLLTWGPPPTHLHSPRGHLSVQELMVQEGRCSFGGGGGIVSET